LDLPPIVTENGSDYRAFVNIDLFANIADGFGRGVRAIVTPEPSALPLMLMGIIFVLVRLGLARTPVRRPT